jgi:hypothetical protein
MIIKIMQNISENYRIMKKKHSADPHGKSREQTIPEINCYQVRRGFILKLSIACQIQDIMKKDIKIKKPSSSRTEKSDFPDYPAYPSSEDVFSQFREEDINLDLNVKESLEKPGKRNEKDFEEDMTGNDLDVPGGELDDDQENIGSEDEENNYYSLGGDNHNDLEEDKGE